MPRKKCLCGNEPSFCLPGEIKRKWCTHCKPDNAVYYKKCECGKSTPSFSLPGKKERIWCSKCPNKPDNAIDAINRKCECDKIPIYNLAGLTVGKWCFKCKPENAVNIKHKKCKQCNIIQASDKYEGFCIRCFVHLFPDKPVSRNYKIKEKHIFDTVIKLLPTDITILKDKSVGGCSRRRPDLMIDLGSHWICAENDENCHKDYDTSCENKRIMELYTDMAQRPMILIRFNCDKYSEGKSLFKLCRQTGISLIRSKKEFKERTTAFAELINKYIQSEPPEKAITTEYLYYD